MSKDIVIIDSETLSLKVRAAVWEIAALRYGTDDDYRMILPHEEKNVKHQGMDVLLDIVPQMVEGRYVDHDTLQFQQRTFGGQELSRLLHGWPQGMDTKPALMSPREALIQLQTLCLGADEVWIYKASFDYGVLQSLADEMGLGPLWSHRAERCLRTVALSFGLPLPEHKGTKHRALADVQWNMEVLARYGGMRKAMKDAGLLNENGVIAS
jgi:hypothetical protein